MPVPILSLPGKDLQYTLKCMDLGDVIAFSICSKRTKNLVKESQIQVVPIYADVYNNRIRLEIAASDLGPDQDDPDQDDPDFEEDPDQECVSPVLSDSFINLDRGNGIEVWRKQEFTRSDWIAHFLSIFNKPMIHALYIENMNSSEIDNISIPYLDTVKQLIPKCQELTISHFCSDDIAKAAFCKLSSIFDKVRIHKNIFDNDGNDFSKLLSRNLKSSSIGVGRNAFKLTVNDLLALNITNLEINEAIITGKELNRFLRLWMKRSHTFYRPKHIRLWGIDRREVEEEVLRGIKFEDLGAGHYYLFKRGDGKGLSVYFHEDAIDFDFE
ncbi:unnamed protein product [Caenorhabditis nigoni]